jgi:hypothetical protein
MSQEPSDILDYDFATVMKNLGSMASLMSARYGYEDLRAVRAEDARGAVQRLLWALERQPPSIMVGSAAASRPIAFRRQQRRENREGGMTITNGPSAVTRQELEHAWRSRVEETQNGYREATERYRKLLQARPDGQTSAPNGDLALARKAESRALVEYSRALQIYTDLIVNGKMPEEQSVASARGA